ncbi:MAG: DUF2240 family protein [Candidatus Hodarchaeota archaeon]
MKISVPRKSLKEMTLYFWKIFEYPQISKKELLFRLSFDLSLLSPNEALEFIKNSIENKFLIEQGDDLVKLSPDLEKTLKIWQNKRKNEILNKIKTSKKAAKIEESFYKDNKSSFNILLKALLDKGTLNRAVNVSDDSITLSIFDLTRGIIKAQIIGSKKDNYIVEININNKSLKHDCHDFLTKRLEHKKFCKHLAKLFLFLKEKDENSAKKFLESITENIEKWGFSI